MALSDTIGKELEVFASKTTAESQSAAFTEAHPGAISFTTDGAIVFGGKDYSKTTTDNISIGAQFHTDIGVPIWPTQNLTRLLSSICLDADRLQMTVGINSTLSGLMGGKSGNLQLGSVLNDVTAELKERISTIINNAAQNLKIHGDPSATGGTTLKHLWSLLGLNDGMNNTLYMVLNNLGTFLSSIPTAYVLGSDRYGNDAPLGSVLADMRDPREMVFPYNPAIYMSNASLLLGSLNLYEGMWLGTLLDEMCREISYLKSKVK